MKWNEIKKMKVRAGIETKHVMQSIVVGLFRFYVLSFRFGVNYSINLVLCA